MGKIVGIILFIFVVALIIAILIIMKIKENKKEMAEREKKRKEREEQKRESLEIVKKILEEKQRKKEEERKREEESLKNKPFEWFYSEEGVKALQECISPKSYLNDKGFSKSGDENTPSAYFEGFTKSIKNVEMFEFDIGWKTQNIVATCLFNQAKPIFYDEDGEPKIKEPIYNFDEILSFEKKPVLYFVKHFKGFSFMGEMDVYEKIRKSELILEVIAFLYNESSKKDIDVISNNQWIFEESSYLNELGTLRDYKSFFKKGIELSTNPDYFNDLLKNQNNFSFPFN